MGSADGVGKDGRVGRVYRLVISDGAELLSQRPKYIEVHATDILVALTNIGLPPRA